MDELDALIGVAASYIGVLSPAYGIVQKIWNTYISIKFARAKCGVVIRRAACVIKTINDRLQGSGVGAGHPGLEDLMKKLGDVQAIMQKQAGMSFFKALLRFDEINFEIDLADRHLSDCLHLFEIDLLLEHLRVQNSREKESSSRLDRRSLEKVLSKIAGNYEEVLRHLKIRGREAEDEAMAAMEKKLNTSANSQGSIEREIIQKSLECIKVTTGRNAPKQSNYTITRYELDLGVAIGGGGFSTVLKAQFRGMTVAVKELKDVGKETLEQEIEIWSKLRHDHVVPFYGASTLSSPPYIVSRYMKNGNLVQYLSRRPNADRIKLLHEISLGMRFLHEENVVHGDLKGVNVLVDDSGKACITDFGLSKARSMAPAESNVKVIAGTLRFLAPEALRGQPLTFETDVYAFGMVIYEIFAGQIPFLSEPDHLIREGCLELTQPTSREAHERGLDNDLWSLLSTCISRDPSRRPTFATIQRNIQSMKKGASFSQELDPATTRLTENAATTRTFVNSTSRLIVKDQDPKNEQSGFSSRRSTIYDINNIYPICAEVTMKYFDVEFGLCKQREPAVHLEEDNASRWHPMHPLKDSFLRVEGNCLTCMRSIGTGRNTWELSGNDVLFKSPSDDRAVCRFREAQTARKWFELEVKYAKNGTVDGWDAYNVRGDWCTTNMIWRRVVDGKFQRAAAIEGAPNLAPANRDWSTVEMPKRCLMGDLTRNNFFACTVNPGGSQASEWRYKIQGRMITSETYRRQGDQRPSMVREEVYPGEEEAQVMFSVMRAALGKVANNNNKGKWFNW